MDIQFVVLVVYVIYSIVKTA